MAKEEIESEIEELRKQVAALKAEKTKSKAKVKNQSQSNSRQTSKSETAAKESINADSAKDNAEKPQSSEPDINKMFQELVESIDGELKEANPMTVLVVFALGVLVGRLLPR